MDKTKQLAHQENQASTTPIMYWGTIALAVIGMAGIGATLVSVLSLPKTIALYIAIAIYVVCILIAAVVIVLTVRGRQDQGARLVFYPLVLIFGTAPFLFTGRIITASFSVVTIAGIVILQLLPKASRRSRYVFLTGVVLILMWVLEWIKPAWRIEGGARSGPATAIIFGLILAIIVVRQTWGRSMRNKLLVSFVGVTLVAAGALAAYVYISTNNILQQGLGRELEQHTDGVALSIGTLLNQQVSTLSVLALDETLVQTVQDLNQSYAGEAGAIQTLLADRDAQWRAADAADNNYDPLVRTYLNNAAAQSLKAFQKSFPDNVEVFITDVYGGQAGTTNRTSDYLQADEGWWQAAYNNGQGAVYISEPEYDESAQALSVLIALPLRERSGRIVGILRTTYLASALNPILGEALGQTGETDLFIPAGEAVSHYNGEQYTPFDPALFTQIQTETSQGLAQMDYEGTASVVLQSPVQTGTGNSPVDSLGWLVVYHQHQDEAFAPITTQARGTLIVTIIVLVLAVAAALLLSIFLVRPISQLTQTAEAVAAGNLNSRAIVTSTDEIGILATTFNSMTTQLQDTLQGLEARVAARTQDLATVAEVGTATATILESKNLLQAVVDLTKERFKLYHSHIYLLDEAGENLVLAAGAGEVGRTMVAEKRSIPLSRAQSLVARAARERTGVTVNDVTTAPDFLPNPLLPETRAELAVPMLVGGNLIGVFDIQSEQVGRFTDSDINIQTTLAAQVATSIQNVRQFERSKTQADLESYVNAIGQKIQNAATVDEVLQIAARELGTALGAARVKANVTATDNRTSNRTDSFSDNQSAGIFRSSK